MKRPEQQIQHGTLRAYVIDKCRCGQCKQANRDYCRAVNRLRAYGQWEPYVDARPVREHLVLLAEFGIGWQRAARLAGVPTGTASRLLYGTPDRAPSKRVRPQTADRLLAVRPVLENLADSAAVDATGTVRRLHALMARGFSLTYLAARLGMDPANLSKTLRGTKVRASTARSAIALYKQLWDADPAALGVSARSSRYALNLARRGGWPLPMEWGEEIDDPAASPVEAQRTPRPLALAEDVEFIRRTTGVTDLGLIADRLQLTRESLDRALGRARALRRAQREQVAA